MGWTAVSERSINKTSFPCRETKRWLPHSCMSMTHHESWVDLLEFQRLSRKLYVLKDVGPPTSMGLRRSDHLHPPQSRHCRVRVPGVSIGTDEPIIHEQIGPEAAEDCIVVEIPSNSMWIALAQPQTPRATSGEQREGIRIREKEQR